MNKDTIATLEKMAASCRILEMEGHGDMTLGHISARDPSGRGFWMKRNAVGLGEIRGPDDFVLVDYDTGDLLEGTGGRHSEWPIHSEIYRSRPEINAVAHTHPSAICAFSALKTDLLPLGVDANYFDHPVPFFNETAVLIKSKELGRAMADAMSSNMAVILANHGVTFCGRSIEEMTLYGIWLESACSMHLRLGSFLKHARIPSQEELVERKAQILTDVHIAHSWNYLTRKLASRYPSGVQFYA